MSMVDRSKTTPEGSLRKKTAENSMILNILALIGKGRCGKTDAKGILPAFSVEWEGITGCYCCGNRAEAWKKVGRRREKGRQIFCQM